MPVAVWSWSAQAQFVREQGIGLVIDRLSDLPGAIAALTPEAYASMAANARAIGMALREGRMTREAFAAVEELG